MDYIDIFIKNDYIDLKQIAESGSAGRKYVRADILLFLMDGRHVFFRKRQESVFCVMRRMRNILEGIWI